MSARSVLVRSSMALALVATGVLAFFGALSLRLTGAVAVGLAAVVAAGLGAGLVRGSGSARSRHALLQAAWRAAAAAATVVLVLSGAAAVFSGLAPVAVSGWVALVALAWWLRRADAAATRSAARPRSAPAAPRPHPPARPSAHPSVRRGTHPAAGPPLPPGQPGSQSLAGQVGAGGGSPELSTLSVEALGAEWLRTTAALEVAVQPAVRERIVQRRREALDELERRDPAGFARWLATAGTVDSNPAQYLRGDSSAGSGTG